MKKLLFFIFIIFVFIIVFFSGFYFGFSKNKNEDYSIKNKFKNSIYDNLLPTTSLIPNISLVPTFSCPSPTLYLKKFKYNFLNFEFDYLPEWQILVNIGRIDRLTDPDKKIRMDTVYINFSEPQFIGVGFGPSGIIISDSVFLDERFNSLNDYLEKYFFSKNLKILTKEKIINKRRIELFKIEYLDDPIGNETISYFYFYQDKDLKSHIFEMIIPKNLLSGKEKIIIDSLSFQN